jgi:hypothetical protein
MDQAFYKYQLGLLGLVCAVLIAFERYLKSKKTPDHLKDLKIEEESLEVGHPVLQTNGAAVLTSNTSRAGALNTLMRKYLLVYAIVMGQFTRAMICSKVLISFPKAPIGSKAHTSIPSIANNMISLNG